MECKNCLYYEKCDGYRVFDISTNRSEYCKYFKDKSLIVELPCKLGDQVYYIKHGSVFDYTIDEIENMFTATENGNIVRGIYFESKHIGKDVFLTREEAEKKLEEIKKIEGEQK